MRSSGGRHAVAQFDRTADRVVRAIELSKQEFEANQAPSRATEVIAVDANDVDVEEARFKADMLRAIKESEQLEAAKAASLSNVQGPAPSAPTPAAQAGPSFLSERAQMEKERLERLKRRRPDLHQQANTVVIDDDSDNEEQNRGAKRQHISSSSSSGTRRANTYASTSSSTAATASSSRSASRPAAAATRQGQEIFWDGELRQTANKYVIPAQDNRPLFRLSEILTLKEDIEFAIISAYCWDYKFVYQLMDRRTPVIAVDHSPTGEASIKAILPNWIRTTPFLRGGFGCMHMKFMLLFFRTGRLRIVVSTANLVEYDWRDIENTVWVQDVPKRPSPEPADPKVEDFASALVRMLHGVNVAPALVNHLKNEYPNLPLQRLEELRTHWDFSRVKARLIPSIAGKHEGWPKVILTGHTCLMKSLKDIGAETPKDKDLVLECQGSSVGAYTTAWLNEFYCSARGESAQTWLDGPKSRRAKLPLPPIKILFPTAQYVRDSVLGEVGGGTMFCRRKQWEGKNFPRELFHQTRSKRGRVLMHSKMVLGTFRDKRRKQQTLTDSEDEAEDGRNADSGSRDRQQLAGWVYVGSHNFTPSAWGTLTGSAFNPTLNITNYELGVLIPLHSQQEIDSVACWERPPQKYVIGRDEPWIQSESPAFVEDV
ncbi:phospholipase D/nuclease [Dichomitus squalens LYAD-421 SS1]|uniref:Phospholipase D/nuclease n=1 Tax=Dichomitus squalens (strain LYAD-421) TaxID=732165 RepID=R7SYY6_DICSQ|nr:phospholipase D/nuclease [Dichomitus squalens LYAD-421 SS1]EJF61409.1 phospholipase D/nuclease [Dichomitus squalens LYAD-421 SS1]